MLCEVAVLPIQAHANYGSIDFVLKWLIRLRNDLAHIIFCLSDGIPPIVYIAYFKKVLKLFYNRGTLALKCTKCHAIC